MDRKVNYRICPTHRQIIEWQVDQDGARWCFYKVADSPNDAKRSLHILQYGTETTEQPLLLEVD